jgi:hypothetical protein
MVVNHATQVFAEGRGSRMGNDREFDLIVITEDVGSGSWR